MMAIGGVLVFAMLLAVFAPTAAGQSAPAAAPQHQAPASAQKSPSSPTEPPTASWASYCSAEAGFCIRYPKDWKKQPEVLQGAGLVVAKPQDGQPDDKWPQITAASTFLPEVPEGKESPTFNDVLNVMLDSIDRGAEKKTLQRTDTTAGGLPAQLLKISYGEPNGKAVIEEGVFIDGDDAIYSVVLRCLPEQLPALEAAFHEIAGTWHVYDGKPPTPAPPKATAPVATPPPK